ncbi:hypothetical protein CY35_01G191800 [Sphagnum magellanicum]|jgi:hypothetical protein|nr:hypothetical protein CY35_01G191800 [Sphagnum magellanicum]
MLQDMNDKFDESSIAPYWTIYPSCFPNAILPFFSTMASIFFKLCVVERASSITITKDKSSGIVWTTCQHKFTQVGLNLDIMLLFFKVCSSNQESTNKMYNNNTAEEQRKMNGFESCRKR